MKERSVKERMKVNFLVLSILNPHKPNSHTGLVYAEWTGIEIGNENQNKLFT